MAEHSAIEWTDSTWNPVTGCTRVSPGCAHCYIETTIPFRTKRRRFERVGNEETTGVTLHPERLDPKRVPKGPRIFVNSLSDLFHEEIPDEFIAQTFDTMRLYPDRTFQVLTKRPERAREVLETIYAHPSVGPYDVLSDVDYELGYPSNVWLGVSVENARFTWRADVLREIPAAVRFISAEPLLGSLMPESIECPRCEGQRYDVGSCSLCANRGRLDERGERDRLRLDLTGIDWLIVGGESGGRQSRPMHPDWARELREACLPTFPAPRPAFFFKQWGSWAPHQPRNWHGRSRAERSRTIVGLLPSGKVADTGPDPTEQLASTWLFYHGARADSGGHEFDGREWREFPNVAVPA